MARVRYYTFWLAGILVVVFGLQQIVPYRFAWHVGAIEPQFFISLFSHASVAHLLGNLFALLIFGGILEGVIGSTRLAWVLIAAGVAGNLAGIGTYYSVLGASGAIFGAIGTLIVLRPLMVIWLDFLPLPMIVLGIGYAVVETIGAIANADHTGHLAHLAGFAVGVVFGLAWRKQFPAPRRLKRYRDRTRDKQIDAQLDEYEKRYMGG